MVPSAQLIPTEFECEHRPNHINGNESKTSDDQLGWREGETTLEIPLICGDQHVEIYKAVDPAYHLGPRHKRNNPIKDKHEHAEREMVPPPKQP